MEMLDIFDTRAYTGSNFQFKQFIFKKCINDQYR